jgi:hypothetical protein
MGGRSLLRGLAGFSPVICVTVMAVTGCGRATPVTPVVSGTQNPDSLTAPTDSAIETPSAADDTPSPDQSSSGQAAYNDWLIASDVCLGAPIPDAAPFTGPGPHPILFTVTGSHTYTNEDESPVDLNPASWSPTDGSPVQLVACADVVPGPAARTCQYRGAGQPATLTIDWGDYTITLYDAKTATKIAVTHLRGTSTNCPFSVNVDPGSSTVPVQVSQFTVAQIQQAFGHYIDGSA